MPKSIHYRRYSDVIITLECGHTVKSRVQPSHMNQKYVCRAGTNCGYSVPWVEYQQDEVGAVPRHTKREH